MRRVVCRAFGPVGDLEVEEAADPVPGPGQVLIEVAAAGVNFVDALFVQGRYQIKPPLPFTPGSEVAGTIVAVGDGVGDGHLGQSVVATTWLGGYASHVVVRADGVSPVPAGVALPTAACLIQSYCTMGRAYARAGLAAGETVLVLGAGGGLGIAATDLAVASGATVIAAASSADKRAAATAAGAVATIDTATEDVKARARELSPNGGIDVVVDPVGGALAETALRALRLGGRYVVLGFASGTIPSLPLNQVLLNDRTVVGVDWGAWTMREPAAAAALLAETLAMVGDGRLHPPAPETLPLERAAEALTRLEGRQVTGKVALLP